MHKLERESPIFSAIGPRDPMALPPDSGALRLHGAAPQGPKCGTPRGPRGTHFETKVFKFRWFLGGSDQNELHHTPLLSKI